MRTFLILFFSLGLGAVAIADTKCVSYPKGSIPPEVRVQVWNQFLLDNPKTEYREKILKEIEQALAEMWGAPECDALLRDATVNPFKNYPEKKNSPPQSSMPPSRDATIDPFHAQDGMLVDPFKQKAPSQNLLPLDEDGTYNPFAPNASQGPKGPKKAAGSFTVDPWEGPPAKSQGAPDLIENDGVLVDPFRKKKSK